MGAPLYIFHSANPFHIGCEDISSSTYPTPFHVGCEDKWDSSHSLVMDTDMHNSKLAPKVLKLNLVRFVFKISTIYWSIAIY